MKALFAAALLLGTFNLANSAKDFLFRDDFSGKLG
jgi:hypothetical protein